jgi:hypothetical protein
MRPDQLERRLRERLDALGPAPRAVLLHVLMLPDLERADRIGEFWGNPKTRPITWRANAILLTLATVFLGACDPGEPRTIGVYAEDSAIHIVSPALCPGERIVDITVYAVQGNVVGDSNDEILWKAEGSQGTRNTDMIVGQPPPGFVQRQRFSGELPSDSRLAAVVDTTLTQRLNESFEVNSLRSDEVLTADGYVPLATFRTSAPSRCPG